MLTAVQQDYVEAIYRLEQGHGQSVRITDIAAQLGTRLPTVTRTVRRLTELGLVHHPTRQQVHLTVAGRRMAVECVHRHEDLVMFLTDILGVSSRQAEQDACQMEHGMSSGTAQRLHELLEHWQRCDEPSRRAVLQFRRKVSLDKAFGHLPRRPVQGWRR